MKSLIIWVLIILVITIKLPTTYNLLKLYPILIWDNIQIKNINYGGCGYYALYLHHYLDNKNISNKIVTLYNNKYIPGHIMIYTEGMYIDSRGCWNSLFINLICNDIQEINEQQLRQKLNHEGWTPLFNKNDTLNFSL